MDPIPISLKTGNEPFQVDSQSTRYLLSDFWAWAYSDIYNNTTRGAISEFLVAQSLGLDIRRPREVWAKFDLEYKGHGIEVKSASYHQQWYQEKLSNISFHIPKTLAWDSRTNKQEKEPKRQAKIYVLSLLSEKDRDKINPLIIDQWRYWVIPTSFFNDRKRSQHSITYNSLIKEIGAPVRFDEIRFQVDHILSNQNRSTD